jgi:hypothetical protein
MIINKIKIALITCTLIFSVNCHSHETLHAELDQFDCKNRPENSNYLERCAVVLNVVPDISTKFDSLVCFGEVEFYERDMEKNDGPLSTYTKGFAATASWPPAIIEGTNYLQIRESVHFPPRGNVISAKPLWYQCQIKE